MSRTPLILLGLSVAIVGGTVLLLGPSDPSSPRAARAPAQSPRAPVAVATPRLAETDQGRELAELRHQVRVLAQQADRADAGESLAPVSSAAPEEPGVHGPAIEPAALSTALDGHLSGETHDAAATGQASAHIAERLAESESGELLGLDCGQTLCRSTLGFADVTQRDARLADIGSLMPWDADGFFSTDPDDDLRVSVYFSRDGQPLPPLGDAA